MSQRAVRAIEKYMVIFKVEAPSNVTEEKVSAPAGIPLSMEVLVDPPWDLEPSLPGHRVRFILSYF